MTKSHGLLGHRRIGLLSGPARGVSTRLGRIAGYDAALQDHGIAVCDECKKLAPTDTESGFRAVRELLDLAEPPIALFLTNTFLAVGALATIQEQRLRVPAGISFLMFDDPDWARLLTPPVTAIAQPTHDVGRAAFELLRSRLKGEQNRTRTSSCLRGSYSASSVRGSYRKPSAWAGFVFDIKSISACENPARRSSAKKAAKASGCSGFPTCPMSLASMQDFGPMARIAFP